MGTKLLSVEDFCARAGLGDVDNLAEDVQTKVRLAIEAATVHLESYIRTKFAAVTGQVDEYYVDYNEFPFVGEFPRFYLSRGFVTTPLASLVVVANPFINELDQETPIDTSWFVLAQEKGTLLITGTDTIVVHILSAVQGNRYFLRVTYDAGFVSAADAFGTIYKDTPDWLVEVAFLVSKMLFDKSIACGTTTGVPIPSPSVPCFLEHLIPENIRFLPSALKPLG